MGGGGSQGIGRRITRAVQIFYAKVGVTLILENEKYAPENRNHYSQEEAGRAREEGFSCADFVARHRLQTKGAITAFWTIEEDLSSFG